MDSSKKGGKWFAVLYKALEGISAVLMGLLVVIVLYSVFSRYVLNSSIAWAEEMSRFLMITMVCVGAVTAYFNNEHLGLDILVKFLPARLHRYVDLVRDLPLFYIIFSKSQLYIVNNLFYEIST
jgi:TRAP-type transport system small permease protein